MSDVDTVFRPGDKVKRVFNLRSGAYDDLFRRDGVYTVKETVVTVTGPNRLWLTDGPREYAQFDTSWDVDRFELVEAAPARTAEDAALMAQLVEALEKVHSAALMAQLVELMGKVHEAAVALRKSVEALQESLAKR